MTRFSLRPFLTRDWAAALVAAVLASILCAVAGSWQWNRHVERSTYNAIVEQNTARTAAVWEESPLETLGAGQLDPERAWTPVRLTGSYDTGRTVLVRNRPRDKAPGYNVIVPFETADGTLVINRGWLPDGSTARAPDVIPEPPGGQITIVAYLRPAEPWQDQPAPQGQTVWITPARVYVGAADVVTGAYGIVAGETPAPEVAPEPIPRPVRDDGPHLSYALQWYVLGLGCYIGLGVVARRSEAYKSATGIREDGQPAKIRRTPTDEEIEDAIVDSHHTR